MPFVLISVPMIRGLSTSDPSMIQVRCGDPFYMRPGDTIMESSGKIVAESRDALGAHMILVQNDEGYWNATSMAVQGNREWKIYNKTKKAQEFAAKYAADLGVPVTELVKYEAPTQKGRGGVTWVRRRIALHFLGELSPSFANWAFGVIERYIDGKITTEESKAVNVAYDALLEDGKIKYEQSQKQLQAAQKDLAMSEGERKLAVANQQKFWRQVDHATAEVDDLKKQLGLKRQTAAKRKRGHECKVFLQELSRVLQEYRDGVPGPWPEVEGPLEKSIPELLAWWDQDMSSGWLGRDLSMFGELPAKKGNPKQWNVLFADAEKGSCRYDNVIPAPNHETKAKLWQTGG